MDTASSAFEMPAGLNLLELLESAPDGILVVARSGQIIWANATAESLFGMGRDQLIGSTVEHLMPERYRVHHIALRSEYQSDPHARPMGRGIDLWALRADGTEFPVEISLSPLNGHGRSLTTAVIRDISERRQMERERAQLSMDLEMERERDRIAMDLHDGIMQDIYAAALALEVALADADEAGKADADGVEHTIDRLHDVIRNIRSYIFDLRPREFAGNLADALREMAREFQQNSQVEAEVTVEGDGELEFSTAVALYNMAHEGLSNVQRHAQAQHVSVRLSFEAGSGTLVISDDGAGFDTTANLPEHHRGLRNMASRARSMRATLTIESAIGKGSVFRIEFPLDGGGP